MNGCPRCGGASRCGPGVLPRVRDTSPRGRRGRCAARNALGLDHPRDGGARRRPCRRGARRCDDGRPKRRGSAGDGNGWLCHPPCFQHTAASFRGWRRRRRGVAGGRGWMDDRARHASTDRRPASSGSSSAEGRRSRPFPGGDSRLLAVRQLASGVLVGVHGHLRIRSRGDERFATCAAIRPYSNGPPNRSLRAPALPLSATGDPDFVTEPKSRYTPRCGASKQSIFRLQRAILRGVGRSLEDHIAQLRSCMYQYSRAIYRSIKSLIDPYADRGTQLEYRRAVLCECEQTMERLAEDPHYFARPDRALFADIRRYFPITAQAQVAWAVREGRRSGDGIHRAPDRDGHAGRRSVPLPRDDAQGQGVPADAASGAGLLPVPSASRTTRRRAAA